jgi:hypothetical protein
MKDYLQKIGFDLESFKKKVQELDSPKKKVDYITKIDSDVWAVYCDVDNVLIEMENHVEKNLGKKNFNQSGAYKFVKREIDSIKNPKSKKVLNYILKSLKGKTFIESDTIFEDWINELGLLYHYTGLLLDQIGVEIDNAVRKLTSKLHWLGKENDLIEMFKELISKEFIEDIGDLNDNLSLHFSLEKRDQISLKPEIPFQKINWLKSLNDLVLWYRSMYEKKLIDEPDNKHVLAVYHFKLRGKNIKHKDFKDRYNKVKSEATYKPSQSIKNLIESLPSNK